MGIALQLENFTQLFRQASRDAVVINDLPEDSNDDNDRFNGLIYTKYSTDDLLSNLPSCQCRHIEGEFNLDVPCPRCGTKVSSPLEQTLEPIVYIRAPRGVHALMNPIIFTMLNERFKRRTGFEVIRFLCDPYYKPAYPVPAVLQAVEGVLAELQITRGYNNFVANFLPIVERLFELKVFKVQRKGVDVEPLLQLIREQYDCIFSQHIPLPNRSLLVIEESNVGIYTDPLVPVAVNAIRMMGSIDSPLNKLSAEQRERRAFRTIYHLADFYYGVYRDTLAKKEGIFRKHVYGTRCHFSFRAVISSLTAEHRYDELHIPWGIGTAVFRLHLINKMLRGRPTHAAMTVNQAVTHLNKHAQVYDPYLDELFRELIAECKHGEQPGVPVIFQRNPSLERGSAQAMYITQVKTDPNIPTVSLSILSVKGFNADKVV